MAPNFLALATTLENLGARRLLAKKVNFVPCERVSTGEIPIIKLKIDMIRNLFKVSRGFFYIGS